MRFLALCLIGAASAAAQPALTDFVPPQTRVVFGINLRHILDSSQVPDLKSDSPMVAMMMAQYGLAGMNPLQDVDSLIIASSGEGDPAPTVAVLRGRFGALRLGEQKNPKGIVARIDDSTLIAGDAAIVNAIMQHSAGGLAPALAARIALLSDKYDVWGTGDNPKGFGASKGPTNGFESVDHFEFGAAFQKGLSAEGQIHLRTPADAKKLADSMKFFEAMLKGPKTAQNGTKFGLEIHDGTLKLSLFIPEEELKKAIVAQKAAFTAGMNAAVGAKPQPKPDPQGKIVSNSNGETVSVTLPGGH